MSVKSKTFSVAYYFVASILLILAGVVQTRTAFPFPSEISTLDQPGFLALNFLIWTGFVVIALHLIGRKLLKCGSTIASLIVFVPIVALLILMNITPDPGRNESKKVALGFYPFPMDKGLEGKKIPWILNGRAIAHKGDSDKEDYLGDVIDMSTRCAFDKAISEMAAYRGVSEKELYEQTQTNFAFAVDSLGAKNLVYTVDLKTLRDSYDPKTCGK